MTRHACAKRLFDTITICGDEDMATFSRTFIHTHLVRRFTITAVDPRTELPELANATHITVTIKPPTSIGRRPRSLCLQLDTLEFENDGSWNVGYFAKSFMTLSCPFIRRLSLPRTSTWAALYACVQATSTSLVELRLEPFTCPAHYDPSRVAPPIPHLRSVTTIVRAQEDDRNNEFVERIRMMFACNNHVALRIVHLDV
ncbi:hypothetical protein EV714DRAFT_240612, partial [Schizophyllum commune]